MSHDLNFKAWMAEGELWKAVKHGIKSGISAYNDKRKESTQAQEKRKLVEKIVLAKTKRDLDSAVKEMLGKGYVLDKKKDQGEITKWLLENAAWRTKNRFLLYGVISK